MKIKNIVKLFCISILFVMACNLYVEEKKRNRFNSFRDFKF